MRDSATSARKPRTQTELNADSVKNDRSCYAGGRDFVPLTENYPELAGQWHPENNGEWTAQDFSSGSDVIAWWQCAAGPDHVWQAAIFSRAGGKGCPFCANKKVSVTNSLALCPQVAAEWHPTLNEQLTAGQFTCKSRTKIWWLCRNNSEHCWQAEISRRTEGSGCPYCTNQKASRETCLSTKFPAIAAQLHPTLNGTIDGDTLTAGSSKKVWWQCPQENHQWQATVANRTGKGSGCPVCALTRRASGDRG